jgi:hypothetical protein
MIPRADGYRDYMTGGVAPTPPVRPPVSFKIEHQKNTKNAFLVSKIRGAQNKYCIFAPTFSEVTTTESTRDWLFLSTNLIKITNRYE